MPVEGVDIAWATPDVARIKATGARWVARYFSHDPTKDLTAAEVRAYTAAGLGIVVVWESTAGRATEGYAAGVADALAADTQRKAVGLPANMVIHFAVDEDTSWASVVRYFDGVISVLGLARAGEYGGLAVIVGAHSHGIRYLWQTVGWSHGQWAPYATIRQPGGTTLSGGADLDDAEVPDFGQYPRPAVAKPPVPVPAPVITPVPAPIHHPKELDMIMVSVSRTEVPKTTPATEWPGDFLLAEGKLSHIATEADLAAFTAAGITGPVTISWAQYQSLLAGK